MSGKSDSAENGWLLLLFNTTTYANIANNASSSPLTNLYVAAHTADPGDSGNQSTSECTYSGYARIAVARSSGGWTVTGNTVVPATNPVALGVCSSGPQTITHFSVGELASGSGRIFYSGTVTPNISVTVGGTPKLNITITED